MIEEPGTEEGVNTLSKRESVVIEGGKPNSKNDAVKIIFREKAALSSQSAQKKTKYINIFYFTKMILCIEI